MTVGLPISPEAVIEVCLCHGARRAARALSRRYDAALAPHGVTSGQFALLAAIAANGPVAAARLVRLMRMEASTLSRNLQPLRRAGQVTVSGGAGRRGGQVALTDAGRRTLAAAIPAWQAAQGAVAARLGNATASALLDGLEKAAIADE
jgi:DNA-binding MarR family transcriptional regulator